MANNPNADVPQDRPVIVIGAAGLDMIGRLEDLSLSESFQVGRALSANIRVSFGGVARNVAENLARLGQSAQLITAVGNDTQGDHLLSDLTSLGVDVSACLRGAVEDTASYLAVLGSDGSRQLILEDMKVLSELTPEVIQNHLAEISSAALVFFDANLPCQTIEALIKVAGSAGVPVCADTTSTLLADRLLPHLGSLYMVTANSAEATVLCRGNPVVSDRQTALQAARKLVNEGVELAVIPLAEFGVVYATSETSGHIPAVMTRVLDPTGAGDALTATVMFGLLNDISIDESVRLGVTAASLILRYRGTVFPGLSLEKLYDELVM